jgi:beta-lactamase regulating signal transducer with metallopeptidase domain
MTACIIKSFLCSGIFLALYKILLEKEKLHVFNRVYLILAVILSLTAPLWPAHLKNNNSTFSRVIASANESLNHIDALYQNEQVKKPIPQKDQALSGGESTVYNNLSFQSIVLLLYMTAVIFLLFRMIKNIYQLFKKINRSTCVPHQNAILVLIDKPVMPFTFLHYVFVDSEQYYNNTIHPAILEHELIHARQKHTLDIIFIEIAKAFFFFNPCLYSYKKAIRLNHEFLSDNEAKKITATEKEYQYLLITSPATTTKPGTLANSFHYIITKKRIKMVTHTTTRFQSFLRKFIIISATIATPLLFSFKNADEAITKSANNIVKLYTQDTLRKPLPYDTTPKPVVFLKKESVGFMEEGVPQEELDKFHDIISRYYYKGTDKTVFFPRKITGEDKQRLEAIYKKMSLRQQSTLPVVIIKPAKPLPRIKLSEQEFQNFKNAGIYGIWIDGRKVPNTALDNYKAEDFSGYCISKLYGAAKKGRSYTHQADLMTNAYYDKYYKAAINNKENLYVVLNRR